MKKQICSDKEKKKKTGGDKKGSYAEYIKKKCVWVNKITGNKIVK